MSTFANQSIEDRGQSIVSTIWSCPACGYRGPATIRPRPGAATCSCGGSMEIETVRLSEPSRCAGAQRTETRP